MKALPLMLLFVSIAQAQPAPPPHPAPANVVEFRSTGKATQIGVRIAPGRPANFLCETPCNATLPFGPHELEAAGAGQRPVPFGLLLTGAPLAVKVKPGSKAMYASGIGLTTAGLLSLGLATIALGLGGAVFAGAGNDGFLALLADGIIGSALVGTGAVLGAAGIALIVPGAVLWAKSEGHAEVGPLRPQVSFGPMSLRVRF